jgi:hypothetical protein
MKYFYVGLGIPGTFGDNTVYDYSTITPTILHIHFELDDEPDAVFTKVGYYIASAEAKRILLENGVSGVRFYEVEVSVEPAFAQRFREVKASEFFGMKVEGKAFSDDFGMIDRYPCLVVSQRALELLQELGIPGADVEAADE